MPIPLRCPNCAQTYRLRDDCRGGVVRCRCGQPYAIPADARGIPDSRGALYGSVGLLAFSLIVGGVTLLWVTADPTSPAPAVAARTETKKATPVGPGKVDKREAKKSTEVPPTPKAEPPDRPGKKGGPGPGNKAPPPPPPPPPPPAPSLEELTRRIAASTSAAECETAVRELRRTVRGAEARSAAVELLKARTRFTEAKLQKDILDLLKVIGPPRATEADAYLLAARDRDRDLRLWVISTLGALGDRRSEATAAAVRALGEVDAEILKAAVTALGVLLPGISDRSERIQVLTQLLEQVDKPNEPVRTAAVSLLLAEKPSDELAQLCTQTLDAPRSRPQARRLAAQILGTCGAKARDAVRRLCKVLEEDGDEELLRLTAQSLGQIGERRVLATDAAEVLRERALRHPTAAVRRAGLVSLARLTGDELPLKTLVAAIHDEDVPLRDTALKLLQERGERREAKENLGDLREALRSQQPRLVRYALVALVKHGEESVPALPEVLPHLTATSAEVRLAAFAVVQEMKTAAREAAPLLLRQLSDRKFGLKAAEALAHVSLDAKEVREANRKVIAQFREGLAEAREVLVNLGPLVAHELVQHLGALGKDERALQQQIQMLEILKEIGPRVKLSGPDILEVRRFTGTSHPAEVRQAANDALNALRR